MHALHLLIPAALLSFAPQGTEPVQPFLDRHCVACHGAVKPKGNLRLDQLSADFSNTATRDKWLSVVKRVQAGEMPPKGKARPAEKDIQTLADWVQSRADDARRAQGRVVLRRLNRTEYENTIRDLLGISVELKDLLPADSEAFGFDNVGEALHVSSFLLERYLEAADKALGLAIANLPQPKLVKKRLLCKDERHVKVTTERVFRHLDDGLVFFSSSPWQAVTMSQFYPPDRGLYRFRISASGHQSGSSPVIFRVDAGPMLMATRNHLVGYFDAPPADTGKSVTVEFSDHLEARSTIRLLPYGLASAQAVNKVGADNYKGPGLAVHWVEVEGPLHDAWPPESHRRLFGNLTQASAPDRFRRDRVEVVSKDPTADGERILRDFARRAFRREVSDKEIQPFVQLVQAKLKEKRSFEQAVRVGLTAMLVSPEFLFLREKPGPLDDFALASRLSYFLWSSMPDEELLTLAARKKLSEPDTLRRQTERLLQSPKSRAFTENFVGQWLGLRDIDFTVPSHLLYPEYDELLKVSMVRETELFFDEVLKDDLSLTNFVASDFTMLNERLARHYGIPGVKGYAFRKVKLPAESHRGGVLTMASVLKVTANGTTTSPVTRGAWVLDRILGTPPSPPPPGIAAVEPDIRGATTIRQQLAKHRDTPSCATCHTRIDPPGFALESFDVIGGWRDNYRVLGNGKAVVKDGQRMPYREGLKVDPGDVLPDGRRFANIDEYRKLLLKDIDQIARALTERLLTYATGGAPNTVDRRDLDAILRKARDKEYGFRTLIHEVVQSKAFRHK